MADYPQTRELLHQAIERFVQTRRELAKVEKAERERIRRSEQPIEVIIIDHPPSTPPIILRDDQFEVIEITREEFLENIRKKDLILY